MKPVDAFLHSVRTAFRAEDGGDEGGWAWVILVVGVLVAGLVLARMRAQRKARQSEEAAFARLVAEKALTAADAALIRRLAARVVAAPLVVGTHLDVFERATAAVLAAAPAPAADAPPDGLFAQVGQLRRTLGFHVLPEQFPLLSTRELVSGVRVDVAGMAGMVGEVNEAWFDVECSTDGAFSVATVGQTVRIAFVRGGEARYVARCPVAAGMPAHAPRQLILRHDERPERTQKRTAVRVTVRGEIHLRERPSDAAAAEPGDEGVTHGELVDLSIGGMAIASEAKLKVGTSLRASFEWEGNEYRELPVVVLECVPRSRGVHLARLQFRGLPVTEENRLAAAIARRSAQTAHPAESDGKSA